MCPLCWAALVAQVVFYVTAGICLVVITDLKVGLPLSLVTLSMAAGNMWRRYLDLCPLPVSVEQRVILSISL